MAWARGRVRHKTGEMNKAEARYAEMLRIRQLAGEILRWWFEGWKFKLADKTYYTPDFVVQLPDGTLEIHETKGFWEDDARVKVKVAAKEFPMLIRCMTLKRGVWSEEVIGEEAAS